MDIPHVKPLYGEAEKQAICDYLDGGGYLTEYVYTSQFEAALAATLGVPYVTMVTSGTAALYLALLATGIGYGDSVLVPDLTMIATINAVRMAGATPVLCDIDETGCLDVKFATPAGAKALIYVELNGRCGNMDNLQRFCQQNSLVLIEDSAQALGSKWNGRYLGTFGDYGCFSLGFHKIITTGQGGFIVSHSQADYEKLERLKDFGRLRGGNDQHDFLGFNFKVTDLQAVLGITQLKTLDWRIDKKRQIYEWYHGKPAPLGYVPWFIETTTPHRDELFLELKRSGIESRLMYPPVHSQPIYPDGDFPVARRLSAQTLWLPSSLNLTKQEVEYVNAHL